MSRLAPNTPALLALPSRLRPAARRLALNRPFHPTPTALSGLTNIFETPDLPSLSIAKLTPRGFHLTDDLVIPGGLILLGGRALMWDVDPPMLPPGGTLVDAWKGWTPERFAVFASVVPRPEILLLGTGDSVLPAPKAIKDYVSGLGMQLDVMDSVRPLLNRLRIALMSAAERSVHV
jgi:NADH dehydrogenase [ubiquinone] 1 alpha subcomplex assembly factor 3